MLMSIQGSWQHCLSCLLCTEAHPAPTKMCKATTGHVRSHRSHRKSSVAVLCLSIVRCMKVIKMISSHWSPCPLVHQKDLSSGIVWQKEYRKIQNVTFCQQVIQWFSCYSRSQRPLLTRLWSSRHADKHNRRSVRMASVLQFSSWSSWERRHDCSWVCQLQRTAWCAHYASNIHNIPLLSPSLISFAFGILWPCHVSSTLASASKTIGSCIVMSCLYDNNLQVREWL